MDLRNDLTLTQKQIISPQLRQSLNILSMTGLELSDFIIAQYNENPLLEINESDSSKGVDTSLHMAQWLTSHDFDSRLLSYSKQSPDEEQFPYDIPNVESENLQEYLLSQLNLEKLSKKKKKALLVILTQIDSSGYFVGSLSNVAKAAHLTEEEALSCLEMIWELEPYGVGARTLAECLSIQLKHYGIDDETILKLINNHLDDLAASRFSLVCKRLGIDYDELRAYYGLIRELNPRPGMTFGASTPNYIVPDVIVAVENGQTSITLNDSYIPKLYINSLYRQVLNSADEAASKYLSKKFTQAQWTIKCIEQRRQTIINVVAKICELQRSFFTSPQGRLKPMSLKEIAESLNIHESTVSRAIKGKYLQCSKGIYPIRWFFTQAISSSLSGGQYGESRESVKELIKNIISAEDKRRPLSDSGIAEILKTQGIYISRRTVTKYREEMSVPASSKRKVL